MEVVKIVATAFDSIFLCLVVWVGVTAKDRKQFGVSLWLMIMTIINLFCMWG